MSALSSKRYLNLKKRRNANCFKVLAFNAVRGEDRPGAFRLDGIKTIYASPVAAAGRIYLTDLDGATIVLVRGGIPRVLAVNLLSEPVSASATIAGKELFLRGEKSLLPSGEIGFTAQASMFKAFRITLNFEP